MKSMTEKTIALPVHGMTCGGCAVRVEQSIQKLPGISRAKVDLDARRVKIVYDPNQVDLIEFHREVIEAGYRVPTSEATLTVQGMSCISCVSHVQGTLEDLPGVLDASVDLAKGATQVHYIPDLISPSQLSEALTAAGYPSHLAQASSMPELPETPNARNEAGEQRDGGFAWRFKTLLRRN